MLAKFLSLALLIFVLFLQTSLVSAQTATQTFTKNGNTYVVTKTIANGQTTIETKIYDSTGNLIKTDVVHKDAKPTPVKTYPSVYPTKNPAAVSTKAPVTVTPMLTPVPTAPMTPANDSLPYQLKSTSPIEVTPDGKIVVNDGTKKEFNTTPEQIMAQAQIAGIDTVQEFSLTQPDVGQYRFLVKGVKQERFLALVQVKLQTALTYNADTGELEKTDQTLGTKILDILSF